MVSTVYRKRSVALVFLTLFALGSFINLRVFYSYDNFFDDIILTTLPTPHNFMPIEGRPTHKTADDTPIASLSFQNSSKTKDKSQLLAFIRIPKTGSTSMQKFLVDYSGLLPLDFGLPADFLTQNGEFKWIFGCIFGSFPNASEESNKILNESYPISEHEPTCAHLAIDTYQRLWHQIQSSSSFQTTLPATMEAFTIVREPYDTLRSFYSMHRSFLHHAKHTNTDEQMKFLEADDFPGWLEAMNTTQTRKTMFQYEFLSKNLDDAIDMLQGDTPQVTILLNECYAESLRLLDAKYDILRKGAVDEFMASQDFQIRQGNKDVGTGEAILREKAKEWFPEEYRFYNAAVDQFKRQISVHGIKHLSLHSNTTLMNPTCSP